MDISKVKNSLKKIFVPGQSLSKKIVQGTFWLFSFRIVDQIFRLVRTIVLAHLLAPKDFGLFGITVMATSLLDAFSQSGFQQALIQKKGDVKPYFNTGWSVQIIRGIILASILFFSAPFVAVFFKAPEAEQILRVVSFAILLQGVTNIAVVYFSKELEFHKYFLYQICGTLADFIVAISAALIFHSVWALVLGLLASTLVECIFSYIIYPHHPHFNFDFAKAKELLVFGRWIFISNIIVFFVLQADSFFVAKIIGITALGFYQMAYKIPSILAVEILAGAIFPAYSKIQDDLPKIKEAYLKILRLFSFILIPMAGGISVLSSEFIMLFLGTKWLPAVGAMQVLCISTLIWTVMFLSDYVFLAIGKPDIGTKGIAIRLLSLIILLYPFIIWQGILGAAFAVLTSVLISSVWFISKLLKIIDCKASALLKNIVIPIVNTLLMVSVIFVFKNFFPVRLWSFLMFVAIGISIYFALTYISDKFMKNKMIPLFKEIICLLVK